MASGFMGVPDISNFIVRVQQLFLRGHNIPLRGLYLPVEPGPRKSPTSFDGRLRNAQKLRDFLVREANEEAQVDQFGQSGVLSGQFLQRLVNREQFLVAGCRRYLHVLNVHASLAAAVAQGASAPGVFDENAAHRLSCGAEEVGAPVELWVRIADQPQPGLVDERGGLQRLARRFLRHARRGQFTQFFIDQRQQFVRAGLALVEGGENLAASP